MTQPIVAMTSAPRRRVTVIVNPATRRDASAVVAAVRRATPADVELTIAATESAGHAVHLAREAIGQATLVVAVGGDGTVADVATGIRGAGIPLGIVPAGSTNIIARELGIPTDPAAAARLLFAGHRLVARDLGICGNRAFLHMAGAGLDSRFFERTDPALKRRVGWLAYLPPAAKALRDAPTRFRIVADAHRLEVTSPLVIVANGPSIIAPRFSLDADIRSDDGVLDVLIFTATGAIPIARTLGRLASLRLQRSPFLLRLRARTVILESDPPIAVQLDGDVVDRTPVAFAIEPGAIQIVAPR